MGDGGGNGLDKSITGGSFFTFTFIFTDNVSPAADLRLCARDLDLDRDLEGDSSGEQSTSRGGVKRSGGGSYGGRAGVAERERRREGEGWVQSARGFVWCEERRKARLVGDAAGPRAVLVGEVEEEEEEGWVLVEGREGEGARATNSTWRLDCLRGLLLGVASGAVGPAPGPWSAGSMLIVWMGSTVVELVWRFRLVLDSAGCCAVIDLGIAFVSISSE